VAAAVRWSVQASGDASDEALAARAVAGEREAFDILYRRWSPRVLRFAQARLGGREDAEDVTQEVFAALLRCLSSYRGQSRFGTWLLGIAYHLICRAQRRRGRADQVSLGEAEDTPAAEAGSAEQQLDATRALARCVRALEVHATRSQREIFWLCYGQGRSAGQVARSLRRSPETVRAQLCRARRTLLESTPGLLETLESQEA
jgi:RNA polymerase sigma-70 factor (ECF subfamily)